jgi:beta-lactamase regulating signal transducer with metallopeptidase domain
MNWLDFANIAAATALSSALNSIWLGLLLAGLAALMLRVMPRSNATTRYAVWFTTSLLILAVPPLFLLVPRPVALAATLTLPAAAAPLAVPVTTRWPVHVVMGWLAISIVLVARLAYSLYHIQGLKRRATLLGMRGNVRVLSSAYVRVPMAAGFVRRAIIFPRTIVSQLSTEEFEQVLSHELAHLRRWDDWTQLLQEISQAVLFFNPVVHWIGKRLEIEREIACDQWVVSATGKARPYAACLTHLHELTRRAGAPQLAPGATGRKRWQISARIEALLAEDRHATPGLSRSGWLAACALASAALVVATQVTPPVGVAELPLATISYARLNVPAAPGLAMTPVKATPAKPRLLAGRVRKPSQSLIPDMATIAANAPVIPAAPYILVRSWRVEASPAFMIITVVFFEPPPVTQQNRI